MQIGKIRLIATSAMLMLSADAVAISPVYTLQGGIGSVDIDSWSDDYYYLTGSVLVSKILSPNSIIDLNGEISTYDYSDLDGLDGEELFLEANYNYTPRAGFQVPTYSLGLRYVDESLSNDRWEGSTLTLLLGISYRLNDRTSVKGGLKAGNRDGDMESDPMGYFVNLDYRYSPAWLWYATLGKDEGVFSARSYCTGNYASAGGSGYSWWSWNQSVDDCETTYLTAGASYVINAFNTLELSLSHRQYDRPGGNADGDILSVDFFHRF